MPFKGRRPDLQLIDRVRKSYTFNDYLRHRAKQYKAKEMIIMARKCRCFDKEFRSMLNKNITLEELKRAEKKKQPLPGIHLYLDDVTAISYETLRRG